MEFLLDNFRGHWLSNLWVCCKKDTDVQISSNTEQQITIEASWDNKATRIFEVYASTNYIKRRVYGMIYYRLVVKARGGQSLETLIVLWGRMKK